jgi:hypothetical protein
LGITSTKANVKKGERKLKLTDRVDGLKPQYLTTSWRLFCLLAIYQKGESPLINLSNHCLTHWRLVLQVLNKIIYPRSVAACPHNLQFDRFLFSSPSD